MAGWHHWLDGRESEWTPGVGDGQGGLERCDSWGRKESDMTERLNWTELRWFIKFMRLDEILQRVNIETRRSLRSKSWDTPGFKGQKRSCVKVKRLRRSSQWCRRKSHRKWGLGGQVKEVFQIKNMINRQVKCNEDWDLVTGFTNVEVYQSPANRSLSIVEKRKT